jgi:hypothetical protein
MKIKLFLLKLYNMKDFIEILDKESKKYASRTKLTLDNGSTFEYNCKFGFLAETFSDNVILFEQHKKLIGKNIYKIEDDFNYSETPNPSILNRTGDKTVKFTKELFYEFQINAIKYWIKYYSEDLIIRCLAENSSSKISNLIYEWKTGMKQVLIEFYKAIINGEK